MLDLDFYPSSRENNYPLRIRLSDNKGGPIIYGFEMTVYVPSDLPTRTAYRIIETRYGKGINTSFPDLT